jgi:glycerate kinase
MDAMPLTVVVCPDSFKGTATARDVATSIASGWLRLRPDDRVVVLPMADGGEGTLAALEAGTPGAVREPVTVRGPGGRPVLAHWLRLPGPDGGVGAVEIAATSGLGLDEGMDALDADSRGFGEAIRAALDAGVGRLLLALGGSATSDGGAGMLRALGARLLDDTGAEVPPGNRGLARLHAVDVTGLVALPGGGATILSDVRSPLLGPEGAVAVFGPQKGIEDADLARAEAQLHRWAELLRAQTDADPARPGAGAAGGAGFALAAWGAESTSGAVAIAEALELPVTIAEADLVITGEGRFDGQTAQGKVISVVQELAHRHAVPSCLIAGAADADTSEFAHSVLLREIAGSTAAAMAEPRHWIERAADRLAAAVSAGPRS